MAARSAAGSPVGGGTAKMFASIAEGGIVVGSTTVVARPARRATARMAFAHGRMTDIAASSPGRGNPAYQRGFAVFIWLSPWRHDAGGPHDPYQWPISNLECPPCDARRGCHHAGDPDARPQVRDRRAAGSIGNVALLCVTINTVVVESFGGSGPGGGKAAVRVLGKMLCHRSPGSPIGERT